MKVTLLSVTDPSSAYEFACLTSKRWIPGEAVISKSIKFAYLYASDILHGPFPEGEDVIATDAHFSLLYATFCLTGRFEKAEAKISKIEHYRQLYLELLEARDIPSPFHNIE